MTQAAPSAMSNEDSTAGDGPPTRRVELSVLFEAMARWSRQSPAATAVSAPDGTFVFAELATRTRVIAGALAANGVTRGTVVAVGTGRSCLTLPGLLAVWWLGAVAVPVDDRDPANRINFILRDAAVEVLLAERIVPGAVPAKVRRVNPREQATEIAAPAPVAADDCAYIIYTSGTSGWPKGVEIPYRAFAVFLDALMGLGLTPGGVGTNPMSPAFDGWLNCTLIYLLHGQGTVLIDLASGDGEDADLAARIAEAEPRTACFTPSLVASCLTALSTVEVLVVAGERCPRGLAERLLRRHRVLNIYGPTEATMAATWADSARGDDVVTIGRPLPGYQVFVLDADGEPVPAGTPGELHIGGAALARGYRNRPELTAERFVSYPHVAGGARLYRTGDQVSARPDGQLEYLGRLDDQVKVRGFRVELGEVERVVEALDEVAAVAAFVQESGDAIGVAVVPSAGADPDPATIRDLCRDRLPGFMVPSAVDFRTVLPAKASGKVDRDELARAAALANRPPGRPPSTAREIEVCDAWSAVLGRPVTDVDANFFELGGHSLLAARAVAALRERTGVRLSMQVMLAQPTVAGLAAELDRLDQSKAGGRATHGTGDSWLVRWAAAPDGLPTVLCLPPAGSGCGRFRGWQAELGEGVSVVGVQLPGRENRLNEPHPSTLDDLVSAVSDELVPRLAPGQPLLVFGESLGGLIGYQLSRRLGELGRPPAALVLAACVPPQLRGDLTDLLNDATRYLADAGVDEDTSAGVLELVRKDFALTTGMIIPAAGAEPAVDAAVHVWGADEDAAAPAEKLDRWQRLLGQEVTRKQFPGGHTFSVDLGAMIPRMLGEILRSARC